MNENENFYRDDHGALRCRIHDRALTRGWYDDWDRRQGRPEPKPYCDPCSSEAWRRRREEAFAAPPAPRKVGWD